MSGKTLLKIAVCVCQEVTLSDFIPPMEILGWINNVGSPPPFGSGEDVSTLVEIHYLAPKIETIYGLVPFSVGIMPTGTYGDAIKNKIQYDIIWVPAGPLPDPVTKRDRTSQEEIDFIRQQAPGAKYVMSVCAGSSILAAAGVLDGKRATTNKALYKEIVAMHKDRDITWVAKARWVVDGKTWTSSGVSAGGDMALAFVEHLVGKKASQAIRGVVEVRTVESSEDDPFAIIHGLV